MGSQGTQARELVPADPGPTRDLWFPSWDLADLCLCLGGGVTGERLGLGRGQAELTWACTQGHRRAVRESSQEEVTLHPALDSEQD